MHVLRRFTCIEDVQFLFQSLHIKTGIFKYDFKDEDEEKRRCDEISKDWPYHSDMEKVR